MTISEARRILNERDYRGWKGSKAELVQAERVWSAYELTKGRGKRLYTDRAQDYCSKCKGPHVYKHGRV